MATDVNLIEANVLQVIADPSSPFSKKERDYLEIVAAWPPRLQDALAAIAAHAIQQGDENKLRAVILTGFPPFLLGSIFLREASLADDPRLALALVIAESMTETQLERFQAAAALLRSRESVVGKRTAQVIEDFRRAQRERKGH